MLRGRNAVVSNVTKSPFHHQRVTCRCRARAHFYEATRNLWNRIHPYRSYRRSTRDSIFRRGFGNTRFLSTKRVNYLIVGLGFAIIGRSRNLHFSQFTEKKTRFSTRAAAISISAISAIELNREIEVAGEPRDRREAQRARTAADIVRSSWRSRRIWASQSSRSIERGARNSVASRQLPPFFSSSERTRRPMSFSVLLRARAHAHMCIPRAISLDFGARFRDGNVLPFVASYGKNSNRIEIRKHRSVSVLLHQRYYFV